MSDTGFIAFFIVVSFVVGLVCGGLLGDSTGRNHAREKFLTFCTEQNISYVKCKEEWERS